MSLKVWHEKKLIHIVNLASFNSIVYFQFVALIQEILPFSARGHSESRCYCEVIVIIVETPIQVTYCIILAYMYASNLIVLQ